jgi:(p)ppGpp synthase/HD superfamily hydrolase
MDSHSENGIGPKHVERLQEAFAYASHLHRTQVRKGTRIPYIAHLLSVCALVLEDGGTEDEAIAALLHDGPEDQGGRQTLDEIRRRFGPEIAAMVDGLSDTLEDPKPPWRKRKEAYLDRLRHEPGSVLRISLADKLHNLRSIATDLALDGDAVWSRFNAGSAEQAWYFRELLAIFEARLAGSRNLPEFRRLVADVFDAPGV